MKANFQYDYIIIGAGLSGLHLTHKFLNDKYFKNHKILIIDKPKSKIENKSFSYWERGNGDWDKLLKKKWSKGKFYSEISEIDMDFSDYNYKTLYSIDFLNFVKNKIRKNKNLKLIDDSILKIREEKKQVIVVGNKRNYSCKHVFDSRVNKKIKENIYKYTSLKQHFVGWVIKTNNKVFNENSFVFMDYRIRDKNNTAFTYVLPFDHNEALIEHTYFSKNELNKDVYENFVKSYIKKIYDISEYKILKTESGIIPMTSYPFHKDSSKKITKIGTAGGWVKSTTGYSFKNCEKYSSEILQNIKSNKNPSLKPNKVYRFLDKIFLGVLSQYNHKGEGIFYKMIKKNNTNRLLRFLDEEASLTDIIDIIISVRSINFVKVFIKSFYKKTL